MKGRGVLRFAVLAVLATAAFHVPAALADNGGSYIAKVMPAAPTIDGTINVGEWDAASSFGLQFGPYQGTAYVGRDANYLYVALRVTDTGGPGNAWIWFDNADNGTINTGDDLMSYTQSGPTGASDWAATDAVGSVGHDEMLGGTNDVTAAYADGADGQQMFEFRKPLCSSDTTHDFCFTQGKLGVDFQYEDAQQKGNAAPGASVLDQSSFGELLFGPPAPTVHLTSNEGNESLQLQSNGAYTVWFNNASSGSFTLSVPPTDGGDTIASASWPSASAAGWHPEVQGQSPLDGVYTFDQGAADSSIAVTSTDADGATSGPRTVGFTHDSVAPSAGVECQPIGCLNTHGPVRVTLPGSDVGSGIRTFQYTLDASGASPTWTDVAPGSTISVTTAAPNFKVQAVDNVGNVGFSTASISGTSPPAQMTWNYANDFQDQSNPGPDLYGNAGVWAYGEIPVASEHDQTAATLYTTHSTPNGQDCWRSSAPEADGLSPDTCVIAGTSPPGTDIDPGTQRATFIRWKSPVSGTIDVTGGFADEDAGCGDGFNWFVDRNGTTLDSGTVANGGSAIFPDATLTNLTVSQGDTLVFGVGPGPGSDYNCDSTKADITITEQAPPAGPSNVLTNGDFEQPLLASQRGGAVGPAPANWLPYAEINNFNPGPPTRSSSVVHGGSFAGHIQTEVVAGGGSEFEQDAPASFDPNGDSTLEAWIYPVTGSLELQALFDWDRNAGNTAGSASVLITPTGSSFGAWGQSSTAPQLAYNAWHDVKLESSAATHTSTLFFDGVNVATISAAGTAYALNPSFGTAQTTVLLGNSCGTCVSANEGYYDDVSLTQSAPDVSSGGGGAGGGPAQVPTATSSTPSETSATIGDSVTDSASVGQSGDNQVAGFVTGTVDFFVCGPLTTAAGCASGGTGLGTRDYNATQQPSVTSDPFTPGAAGFYCFRAEFHGGGGQWADSSDGGADECFHVAGPKQTSPYTVNTTADHDDGLCTTDDCTLREAILAADNQDGGTPEIDFALPTPDHTIHLLSPLQAITSNVYLNGLSQASLTGGPSVVVDGSAVGGTGITVSSGSGARVSGLIIGGVGGNGIAVVGGSNVTIDHNWVGFDATGAHGAGNAQDGIVVQNVDTATVDSNVVGYSGVNGIRLLGVTNGHVTNNKVGVDVTGAAAANGLDGIAVDGGGLNQVLGNTSDNNANQGIAVFTVIAPTVTHDNVVEDNTTVGNGGDGIRVFNGVNTTIGTPTHPNVVTNNAAHGGHAGIAIYGIGSTGNTIRGNSVHDNAGLGIDLGGDGVTPNDPLDADSGPNDLVNYPVLGAPIVAAGSLVVTAKLSAAPSTSYLVDIYTNSACSRSGFGEGQSWKASVSVTTNATGEAAVSYSFDASAGNAPYAITLTTTDIKRGDTSEFSQCAKVGFAGSTTGGTVALQQSATSSPAGASIVTLSNIPRDAYSGEQPPASPLDATPLDATPLDATPLDATPLDATPLDATPLDATPLDATPLDATPLDATPLDATGLTATNLQLSDLGGVPLSELPLLPPKTWAGVLGHDVQEQSTRLSDVISQVHGVSVGDIDWRHASSALATVGVAAFVFGGVPVADIGAISAWCSAISSCSSPTDLAGKTVMDIALAGTPLDATPLDATPLDATDLSGTPLDATPLDATDLAGTPLDATPLDATDLTRSVLGALRVSDLLAAGSTIGGIPSRLLPAGVCIGTCGAATLGGDLLTAGVTLAGLGPSALAGYTIGDLHLTDAMGVTFGNIGPGLPHTITIDDLLRAYFHLLPVDPSVLPLNGIQTIADDPNGRATVTYTAAITLTGDGAAGNAYGELFATLDPSARFVPGSTTLSLNGNVLPNTSADPGVVGGKLAWTLNGLSFGQTYTLSFKVYPGLQLGVDRTTVTLVPQNGPSASDSKDLTVTDTFEGNGGNNTPATATPVTPGKLYLSFEQTQSDTDWYTLPVPPAGTVSTFTLSHLTNDKDIVVLGPNGQQLRSSPLDATPLDATPLDATPVTDPIASITQPSDQLQPAAVQDVPLDATQLANDVVAGVSDNAGTSDDTVSVVSNGASGSYLVHIVDADPTPSNTPYVLDVEQTPPQLPTACPNNGVRTLPSSAGTVGAAVDPTSSPSATTLILADYKRYGDTYGAAAEATLQSDLNTFAAKVGGLVVPVESASGVQTAYNAWDQHTCDPEAANGVVRAIISGVVNPFHTAHPNAKFLVIVGGDTILPFPRIPDQTTTENERSYVGTIGYPKDASGHPLPTNNELVGTAAASYMETDDVWSAFNPSPFLTAPLYVPQWATGRLVEQPLEIQHQLETFNSAGATINPVGAFTAGYSFLSDSANAVASILGGTALVNETWNHDALVGGLALGAASPQIDTINAHYDHYRALPADHGTLFTSSEVKAVTNAEIGRILFSIGCHSGYSVPDELYAQAAGPFALDWPQVDFQSGAVARVANTTYGYGDTDTIGYSEQVEVNLVKRLSQMSLGEALLYAKQQYIADLATVGPYEQKAMNALTFYGLPMLKIGAGTTPTAPTPAPTTTDPVTGLQTVPVSSSISFGSPVSAPGGGQYFAGPDGIDATNNRPFEPKKIVPDITEPGLVPHGFLITGLGVDPPHSGFVAARSRAIPDSPALTPTLDSQVGWPSSLARISSFASPTGPRQELVLLHGQFLSDPASTTGAGTQTNFNQIAGSVLYSTSSDGIPPQLSNIRVTAVPTGVAFEADVTDQTSATDTAGSGVVKEVTVVYYEPATTAISAHVISLTQTPGTNHWTGGGPLAGSVNSVSYFLQAVDAAGNVGLSVHKVIAAPVVLQQSAGDSHLAVTPSGPPSGGWFTGAQSVTISADAGYALTYSVDGGAVRSYTGAFTVSGDGIHLVDAFADNGAGGHGHVAAAIPIDSAAPSITIVSPADGSYLLNGDVVKASFFCNDSGSGIAPTAGCVGTVPNGTAVDATAGNKTFTVNAKDAVGHTASKSASYQVWQWTGFLSPVNNAPVVNLGQSGSAIPVKFQLGGNRGLSFLAAGYPASQKVACDSDAPLDTIEQTVTAGASSLQYDSTSNTYTYVWKTDKSWAGTCRDLTLKFTNGDTRVARFKFK